MTHNLEINIIDLIKNNYINNNFKFDLIKNYNLQLCYEKDILENDTYQKLAEIKKYCESKNIDYNNKYLFGKNIVHKDCDYYRKVHSYIFCSKCSLHVFKDKNITKVYKNSNSFCNNISILFQNIMVHQLMYQYI